MRYEVARPDSTQGGLPVIGLPRNKHRRDIARPNSGPRPAWRRGNVVGCRGRRLHPIQSSHFPPRPADYPGRSRSCLQHPPIPSRRHVPARRHVYSHLSQARWRRCRRVISFVSRRPTSPAHRPAMSGCRCAKSPGRFGGKANTGREKAMNDSLPASPLPISASRQAPNSATYFYEDGHAITLHGDRPYRNNNPGNLRFMGKTGAARAQADGALGVEQGGFAMFPSVAAGEHALDLSIARAAASKRSLTSFVNQYAPPTDQNNTAAYIGAVASARGAAGGAWERDAGRCAGPGSGCGVLARGAGGDAAGGANIGSLAGG